MRSIFANDSAFVRAFVCGADDVLHLISEHLATIFLCVSMSVYLRLCVLGQNADDGVHLISELYVN